MMCIFFTTTNLVHACYRTTRFVGVVRVVENKHVAPVPVLLSGYTCKIVYKLFLLNSPFNWYRQSRQMNAC